MRGKVARQLRKIAKSKAPNAVAISLLPTRSSEIFAGQRIVNPKSLRGVYKQVKKSFKAFQKTRQVRPVAAVA